MFKTCCACLTKNTKLNKLSEIVENDISLLWKLQACISEINWLSIYEICIPCTDLLNIVYAFRQTCIKSNQIRTERLDTRQEGKLHEYENEIETVNDLRINDVKDETCEDFSEILDTINDTSDIDQNHKEKDYDVDDVYNNRRFKRRRKALKFVCEKCKMIFRSSVKLVDHCIKKHDMKIKDIRPFTCDRCPRTFCSSSNLLQHVKYHKAVRSNMCTFCGKGFITKTDLNIHEKHHLNKREYKCDECGKCFNTHKDIRSHKLVVHTAANRWKYQCEICNKPFPIKSNYDSHMRRHTGVRKFECHLCEKKFIDKCVLQRHMRTHSNVKEHRCVHCDKEYKDLRVMKLHMAKVHGIGVNEIKLPSKEKKHFCHICSKSYYAKNKLTRHLYSHSGEKPYHCHLCNKKFSDKSYVKQHLQKTHNIKRDNLDSTDCSHNFNNEMFMSKYEPQAINNKYI